MNPLSFFSGLGQGALDIGEKIPGIGQYVSQARGAVKDLRDVGASTFDAGQSGPTNSSTQTNQVGNLPGQQGMQGMDTADGAQAGNLAAAQGAGGAGQIAELSSSIPLIL